MKDPSSKLKKKVNPKWQEELTPARLFRGWWEELKKAYLRFCLEDKWDCARRCNVRFGLCRLVEDRQDLGDTWQYKCTCQPGYGPWQSDNITDQHLCSVEITNLHTTACGPLNAIKDIIPSVHDSADVSRPSITNRGHLPTIAPIDHYYLCDSLVKGYTVYPIDCYNIICMVGWDCSRVEDGRKKRVVGGSDTNQDAKPAYFPSAVEIMHSPYCNLKGKSKDNSNCKPEHKCGGTLLCKYITLFVT